MWRMCTYQQQSQGLSRIGGNAYPGYPQGGDGAQAVDQDHVSPDVQQVHDGGAEHGFPEQAEAAEKGDKSHIRALHDDKKSDPTQVQLGFCPNLSRDTQDP